MLTLFAAAIVLGFVFNAAPGAVFAETVRQGVRGGFKPAFAVQIGSLVGDALWAVLGLAGVGVLVQSPTLRLPIGLAGVAYLAWLAWDSWRAANREFELDAQGLGYHRDSPRRGPRSLPPRLPCRRKALRAGVVLSVTNPQNVAYWAALGSAMGAVGIAQPDVADYGVFFAGFMASSVLWCFICAALVDRVFRSTGRRWARFTYRACAIAFLALALSSLRGLLGAQDINDSRRPSPLPDRPATQSRAP